MYVCVYRYTRTHVYAPIYVTIINFRFIFVDAALLILLSLYLMYQYCPVKITKQNSMSIEYKIYSII